MSQQLSASNKRKKSTLISAFFKPLPGTVLKKPRVETVHAGRVKSVLCEYCGDCYSPQGIQSHVLWHESRGDVPDPSRSKPRYGKVKVVGEARGTKETEPDATTEEEEVEIEVIECTSESEDDEPTEENMIVDEPTRETMIVDQFGNPHDKVAEESGTVLMRQSSTAQNLSIQERIEILDKYRELEEDDTIEYPKAATVKWVRSVHRLNRPKYCRKQLNRLIKLTRKSILSVVSS